MVTQQIARSEDQIVEVKQRGGALVLLETIDGGLQQIEQSSQQLSRGGLRDPGPGITASGIVVVGDQV